MARLTIVVFCTLLAAIQYRIVRPFQSSANGVHCGNVLNDFLKCTSQVVNRNLSLALQLEREQDSQLLQLVQSCFNRSGMCGISDIFDRDELFAEDGPLSECHKWMSTVEGVITKLSQGTAEQNDCLQQRFLQMLGGMLNSCYQQKTGSSWTLPDYDRNFNSYRTEVLTGFDHRIMAYMNLANCAYENVQLASATRSCMFPKSSAVYHFHCSEVFTPCLKEILRKTSLRCLKVFKSKFGLFCNCQLELDRSMSDKLTLAKKAVFSDVAKRDCVDAVDAATGGLLLNLEAALMTCLNLEQKKAISRLADIGCGKKTIFNEGYKSKLDFAMTFVMAAVHVYKDRVMRFCLAECPVD